MTLCSMVHPVREGKGTNIAMLMAIMVMDETLSLTRIIIAWNNIINTNEFITNFVVL